MKITSLVLFFLSCMSAQSCAAKKWADFPRAPSSSLPTSKGFETKSHFTHFLLEYSLSALMNHQPTQPSSPRTSLVVPMVIVLTRLEKTYDATCEAHKLAMEAWRDSSLTGIRASYRCYQRRFEYLLEMWWQTTRVWMETTLLVLDGYCFYPTRESLLKIWWQTTKVWLGASSLLVDQVCLPMAAMVLTLIICS